MYCSMFGIARICLLFLETISILLMLSVDKKNVLSEARRDIGLEELAGGQFHQQDGACQGINLNLLCYAGFNLRILRAHVGQALDNNCGTDTSGNVNMSLCETYKIIQLVQDSCEDRNSCSINQTVYKYCPELGNYLFVEFFCSLSFITPGLPYPNGSCSATYRRRVNWPTTPAGSWSFMTCPNQPSSMAAKWMCGRNPVEWIGEPDFSNCKSDAIDGLRRNILSLKGVSNTTAVRQLASSMAAETSRGPVYGQDLSTATFVMNELVAQVNSEMNKGGASEVVMSFIKDIWVAILQTSSNLLNGTWIDLPVSDRDKTATQLMTALESSSFQLISTLQVGQTLTNATDNIVSEVSVINTRVTGGGLMDVTTFPRPASRLDSSWLSNSISLTPDTIINLTRDGQAKLVFSVYKNLGNWLVPSPESPSSSSSKVSQECANSSNCTFINSLIISASVNSRSTLSVPLASPVLFTLQHNSVENVGLPQCVSWSYSEISETGDWSSDGCSVVTTNLTHTTCSCSHLTSFAIIMSPTQPNISAANEIALTVITYVGCSISIICYILCFITFLIFKSIQCDRNTIHKNLVLCLLVANVIFLAGIMQYNTPILCAVIAGILHYFFLASFAWMCLEGVQLYVMLVQVFEAKKSPVLWYYLSAYGAPAIIVGVSAAVYHQGYGTPSHCWLTTDRGFVWSFLGPVCVIICGNFLMLGIAIRAMINHAKTIASRKSKEQGSLEQIRLWLKGTIILVFLLGLTWVFGLLFINANSIVFAYIFTILNSFQGLFIFIFHCLMSDKVRKEYKQCLRKCACLPDSLKSRLGETKTTSSIASTPNRSSNKGQARRPPARLLGKKSAKTKDTSLSKSASAALNNYSEDSQNDSCDESHPMKHSEKNFVCDIEKPTSCDDPSQTETVKDKSKGNNIEKPVTELDEEQLAEGCLPHVLYVEVLQQWQPNDKRSSPQNEEDGFNDHSGVKLKPVEMNDMAAHKRLATLSVNN